MNQEPTKKKANDGDDDSEMTLEEKKQALRNKIIAIGKMSRMFQVLREEQENVAHLKIKSGIITQRFIITWC